MNENNNNIGKCSSASGKVKLESKHRRGRFSFLFITPFRRSRQTKTVANDCPNHHHHELEFPSDGEAVGNTALCQSNADIKTKPASQTRNEMKDKLVVHRLTVTDRRANENVHADYASRMSKTDKLLKTNAYRRRCNSEAVRKQPSDLALESGISGAKCVFRSKPSTAEQDKISGVGAIPNACSTKSESSYQTKINAKSNYLQGACFSADALNCEEPLSDNSYYTLSVAAIDKRHSLNLDCLSKRRSWCALAQSDSFPSMVSLPGPETALVGRSHVLHSSPAEEDQFHSQSYIFTQDKHNDQENNVATQPEGTPMVSRKVLTPKSILLKVPVAKQRKNKTDAEMSPFLQRHGIHGITSINVSDRKEKIGMTKKLMRSQSLYKPSKPTTPKPLKNTPGGSLNDLRFRFSQLNLYRFMENNRSVSGEIRRQLDTGSLCDLRSPRNSASERYSLTAVNYDRSENITGKADAAPSRGKSRLVRKRSRPLSEVASSGRWVEAIPEHGILNDTNRNTTDAKESSETSTTKPHLLHPVEGDVLTDTNAGKLFSANGSARESDKRPEDIIVSNSELLSVNDIIRKKGSAVEHKQKRRMRYGIMSASYCDQGSLEDISFIDGNLPRPMSMDNGIDVLDMKSGTHGSASLHLMGYRNSGSNLLSVLTMNSSLSIPAGLDSLDRASKIQPTNNTGYANGRRILWVDSPTETTTGDISITDSDVQANDQDSVNNIYAEALWDHVTMDEEELSFQVGNVICVKNADDPVWWWGQIDSAEGWFPATFVRVLVNQNSQKTPDQLTTSSDEDIAIEEDVNICEKCGKITKESDQNVHCTCISISQGSTLNNKERKLQQMRANVIREIVSSERVFVRHLKDVVEGYINRCRRRADMFSEECIATIFGNIEKIYEFQKRFLEELESSNNGGAPYASDIGTIFLRNKKDFEIYSEYCNNHPKAISTLMDLSSSKKYRHFLEACRLLQQMIDISIDGFLLTPVQKICKYPLQLAELLKYTNTEDAGYQNVRDALNAMKDVAQLINDRKRLIENIDKITMWQKNIISWENEDILARSTELIHSGEIFVIFIPKSKPQQRVGFLFDNQLILCKKDLLRKDLLYYKFRFDLRDCDITHLDENHFKEWLNSTSALGNVATDCCWKIQSRTSPLSVAMFCKSGESATKWLKAFEQERKIIQDDKRHALLIPDEVKHEIIKKSISRSQKQKDNSRFSIYISYRQRLKIMQRAQTRKRGSLFSNTENNSATAFLNNIAVKLKPFRKNSSSSNLTTAQTPT